MPEMTSPQGEVLSVPEGPGVRALRVLGWAEAKPEPEPEKPKRRPRKPKTDN